MPHLANTSLRKEVNEAKFQPFPLHERLTVESKKKVIKDSIKHKFSHMLRY